MNEAAKVEAAYAMVILAGTFISSTFQVPLFYGQLPCTWAFNSSGTPTYPTLGVQIQREGKGREGKGREGKGREGKGRGPLASTF